MKCNNYHQQSPSISTLLAKVWAIVFNKDYEIFSINDVILDRFRPVTNKFYYFPCSNFSKLIFRNLVISKNKPVNASLVYKQNVVAKDTISPSFQRI